MGVTAIILAGGQATRMQGEKPLRVLRGRTLLQHMIDLVSPLASEVLVSAGAREFAGARNLPDPAEYAGQGPLAGILSGLQAAREARALVVACDLPNVPPRLLARLIACLGPGCDCAWAEHGGHPEPLIAAMNTAPAAQAVRNALSKGANKVVPCWESMPHRVLGESDLAEFEPLERAFANLNTLQDLEREQHPPAL